MGGTINLLNEEKLKGTSEEQHKVQISAEENKKAY